MVNFDAAKAHITDYAENRYPFYKKLAGELKTDLSEIRDRVAPHAIVQTRPKSVSSFSEKIFRKPYAKPCDDLTDLCGGRIIAHTTTEVEALAKEIEAKYGDKIDKRNSVDHTQRLKSPEFGYRSIHYIISFGETRFKDPNPKKLSTLRVEVQIRTLLEHAWADISHAYAYKSDFPIPALWQRETFRAAALLENADTLFARMHQGLEQYRVSYGAYMTHTQIREKLSLLQHVLSGDGVTTKSERAGLALTVGRLSAELDKDYWEKAIGCISAHLVDTNPGMFLQRGILRCKLYDPTSGEFKQGQEDLVKASELSPSNVEALVSLAYTYELQGYGEKARENCENAFGLDPSNPRVLTSHLCWEIQKHQKSEIIRYVQPLVRKAIARSQDQIDMRINLPWAFYATGLLHLLLGEKASSFSAYSKAVQMSDTGYIINTHITSVEKLELPGEMKIPGVDTTLRFLKLSAGQKPEVSSTTVTPVVIISGQHLQLGQNEEKRKFYDLVLGPFIEKFEGKILEIETGSELGEMIGAKIEGLKGSRKIIHETRGNSLEMWEEIATSGTSPKDVKLLGLGSCEPPGEGYQMALALGAWVGLIRGTGGQADEILTDKDWNQTQRLLSLPPDAETIQAFILPDTVETFPEIPGKDSRGETAKAIHNDYRSQRHITSDSNLLPWDKLSERMKQSSFKEADSIVSRLKTMGYCMAFDTLQGSLPELDEEQIKQFAKMRHGRWNIERLKDGWTLGPKSEAEKKSPYLVSWDDLDLEVRKWNIEFAKDIPKTLARVGLKIQRQVGSA